MEMINYICTIAFTVSDGNKRKRVEAEIEVKFRQKDNCVKKDGCIKNK